MKIPCLAISGWAYNEGSLAPLADLLSPHLETRLFGSGDGSIERMTRELRAVTEPVILLGWSMGGLMALDLASRHPEHVRSLLLISATCCFCVQKGYPHGFPKANVRTLARGILSDTRQALGGFHDLVSRPSSPSEEERESFVRHAMKCPEDQLRQGLNYLVYTDLRDSIGRLDHPVLLLHGANDAVVPSGASKYLQRALRNSQYREQPDCGHDLPLRSPEWIAEQVVDFVRKD